MENNDRNLSFFQRAQDAESSSEGGEVKQEQTREPRKRREFSGDGAPQRVNRQSGDRRGFRGADRKDYSRGERSDRGDRGGDRREGGFKREFNREDRGERRDFRGDDRREGGFKREFNREDRGERREFRGGDRREGGFKREFNREDRGERRDFRGGDRREGGFKRDFNRGDRDFNRGDRDFNRGDRDFNRDERIDRNQPENAIVPKAPENILFGIHPVKEALEGGRKIEKIYTKRNTPATEGIVEYAEAKGIPVQEVPSEKLDWLARGNNHQGIVASIPQIEYADINQVLEDIAAQDRPALLVVLDGVTDIRNFGAIARTAECVGADAIVISAKSAAPVNAEAIKSSAGALTKLPVCRVGSLRNTLKTIQTAGISLVAATEKCTSLLYEAKLDGSVAVIMGSEDKGISSDILKICDARVSIPLLGEIESLNVSAAAAVVLYEVVRQRFESADQE